jgi:hypothetical protein
MKRNKKKNGSGAQDNEHLGGMIPCLHGCDLTPWHAVLRIWDPRGNLDGKE